MTRDRTCTLRALSAALLGAALLLLTAVPGWAGEEQLTYTVVEEVIDASYDQVISKIEAAVKAASLMIIGEPNYKQMQRMVGKQIRDCTAYLIFRPDLGIPVFGADYGAALEIPMKVLIYDKGDGKTIIRYIKPSSAFANYGSGLDKLGKQLDEIMAKIVATATK